MISVTLTFPSLDAALRGLREVPQNLLIGTPVEVVEPKKEAPAKKEAVKQATASTQPTVEKAAAPEPKAETSVAKPASIEYPVLQKAVFALAGKSREAAGLVAQSFGVKTFKELPEDKWADALAAVNAKIAELG